MSPVNGLSERIGRRQRTGAERLAEKVMLGIRSTFDFHNVCGAGTEEKRRFEFQVAFLCQIFGFIGSGPSGLPAARKGNQKRQPE